ncbi:hypothetical protein [Ruminococcus sp. HUN007]|uniref:hypothetical protein n=1 Tax=Ruminococcus sp. HUN007 TaxID=1514668 RepID=UPI0005D2268E|nr:hypothetical protein [Ruminococcus sp. HUN007]
MRKNPKNLRLLSHLIDASVSDEREKYICEALDIVRLDSELFYSKVIYMQAISYYQTVDRKHALDLCEEYYNVFIDANSNIVSVAIEFLRANILGTLDMYEDACSAFQRYFKFYEKYKNGELNEFEMCTHPIAGLTKSDFETCTYNLIMIYKKLSKYSDAFDILDQLDFSTIEGSKFTDVYISDKITVYRKQGI